MSVAYRLRRCARMQHGQGKQTPHSSEPWTTAEISRVVVAARTIPNPPDENDHPNQQKAACRRLHAGCGGMPARLWWPAFLLVQLDTGCTVSAAIGLRRSDLDHRRGRLAGAFVYTLHSLTIEAIDALRRKIDRPADPLFPWTLDNARPPFCMLYRAYHTLLYRAGLPHVTANLFSRLRVTARAIPDMLDWLDFQIDFTPRRGSRNSPVDGKAGP